MKAAPGLLIVTASLAAIYPPPNAEGKSFVVGRNAFTVTSGTVSNKVEDDGTVTFNLPATTGAEVKFTDSFQALDAAGAPLQNFVSAEPIVMSLYTSKCLVPAAPVVKVNGVEVTSGTSIPLGSRITITNPNANTSAAPKGGVSVYLDIDCDIAGGLDAIARGGVTRHDNGSVEFVLDGNEGECNFGFNYTINDPNYLSFAGTAFTFTNYKASFGMPYVTIGGRMAESGTKVLNGSQVVIVNTSDLRGEDGNSVAMVWPVYTESYTNWATGRPSNDRKTGNSSFTVAGTPGTSHSLILDMVVMGDSDDYTLPLASEFSFAITDTLPDPTFAITGEKFLVEIGYAEGTPGVTVVRSNFTPGKSTPDREYHYFKDNDGYIDGSKNTLYGAYLYGDGFVTSDVTFTRVGGIAPQTPKAPVYAINGENVDFNGIQHVRPGDIVSATNPNWYTIGSYSQYYVADMLPVYNSEWHTDTPEGTFAFTIPSEQTGGMVSMDMEYVVKKNSLGAFCDATFTKQFFVETQLEEVYFTCGDQLLRSGMALYNGSVMTLVNPNTLPDQSASAVFSDSRTEFKDIAAAGSLASPDEFGQVSFELAATPGSAYTIQPRLTTSSTEFFAPEMKPVTFISLAAPLVRNARTGTEYARGTSIPVRSAVAVDFCYDIASTPGAQWHMDIKDSAPSAPGTVPAGILLDGSQGVSHEDSAAGTSFVLSAQVDTPVTLQLYVTDADGTLLTNKAEYTFTPVTNRLQAPYVTVDGVRVESGCEIDNWSRVCIVNPNNVADSSGKELSRLSYSALDINSLKDIVYGDISADDNECTFSVFSADHTTVSLQLAATAASDVAGVEDSEDETFTFTIREHRLTPPVGSSRISAAKVLYSFSDAADINVPDRTLHYAMYSDALEVKDTGTMPLTDANAATVFSQASGVKGIAVAYITAPGCEVSEPSYIYWMGQKHTTKAPRLYVHHRPLEEGAVLSPGDVITVENPYNFSIGEEIPWHMPVEHTLTVGGDVEPESIDYEPWSGHYTIRIPYGVEAARAYAAQQGDAPRRAPADLPTISFTSTLTPLEAHTNAFAAGAPKTYTFAIDPGTQTGVEEVSAADIDANMEIYTLTGVKVTHVENLAAGVYIIIENGDARKVLIK